MTKPYPRPEPVITERKCSLCDEDWDLHGDTPTVLDCIRILKAKPSIVYQYQPYWPITWPQPWQYTPTVTDTYTINCGTTTSTLSLVQDDEDPPDALAVG